MDALLFKRQDIAMQLFGQGSAWETGDGNTHGFNFSDVYMIAK